ncbi:MAG: SRPBCC domain-containing protein [Sphingomonadales bacterium]
MTAGHELAIERVMDVPVDAVWRAVTEHLTEWWCPQPWKSEIEALEWRSGGRFAITMKGPDGEVHRGDGMLLDVVPGSSFTFTNMLGKDWAPQDAQPLGIVGKFRFSDAGNGKTNYRASARQWNAADTKKHAEMGFAEGWGICADQLEEVAKGLTVDA